MTAFPVNNSTSTNANGSTSSYSQTNDRTGESNRDDYAKRDDGITDNSQIQLSSNDDPQTFFIENTKRIIQQKETHIKSLEKENYELFKKNEKLEGKLHNLKKTCKESMEENGQWEANYLEAKKKFERHYKELQQKHANEKENYERNIDNLEQNIFNQKRSFEQKLKQNQEEYNRKIDTLQQKLDENGNNLQELEEKNAKLKEEASKYQSALGVATNIRLGEEDQNHSVNLKRDILNLQDMLENYVTNLKPNMIINIEQVQILAQKYGCLNEVTATNKSFIKTILQRRVLEIVFDISHLLSDCKGEDFALEWDVELKAHELLNLIEQFSTTRVGTDEVVKVAAIKIRQQVYGILGNRGFGEIIRSDGNYYIHNLVDYASDKLNKMMNNYRKINDVNRKNQVETMAPKLIQDIYKLFWFRLKVQEPVTEVQFFETNTKIDPDVMEGKWDDDDNIDQLCVDICYFPLIGRDLESPNRKIYTPAKVFHRCINSSETSISAGFRSFFGFNR